MEFLAPCRWRRRKPEELQDPGDAKRACRRAEAPVPRWDCGPPRGRTREPQDPGQVAPPPSSPLPAREPENGQARAAPWSPRSRGPSPAQPCPRCIAGESVSISESVLFWFGWAADTAMD
ncbi:uncharacterized protein C10orf143 homolog isoform X3 [Echinops telfairi]|uniref:Uncharacterized protein C10orf143 homolog isoform X3 n=1 Tax=Echinops telfairi TaxID=9371 RepID=A0AC55D6Q7_ECHTE|nr:uncharacterized protein C10orf143 homolog isoform X3 [Echinops telfairi]